MAQEPIDWSVAEKVAVKVAERSAPDIDSLTRQRLDELFGAFTPEAEAIVAEATGLSSLEGPARAEVTDRAGWIRANISSFRRLLGPILEKSGEKGLARVLPPSLQGVTRAAAGAEIGAVLGWMSTRVLGQYDLLLTEGESSAGDVVYYVGPNVVGLERRHGFAPNEFRLWIAIHELTHRAQFTGVSWMRPYFLDLVDRGVSMASPEPKVLAAALARAAREVREGRNPLAESGLVGVLATPEQAAVLRQIQALMSLLEGHGDIVMNRAAAEAIPGARRFAETLQSRRDSAAGVVKLLQQLIWMEAKMRQYREGEHFVATVEQEVGPAIFSLVWQGPEFLPSMDEIRDPNAWIERVRGRSREIA